MPDNPFLRGFNLKPTGADAKALPAFAIQKKAAQPVFVDLSEEAAKANIVREGFDVAEAAVVPEAFERWLGRTKTRPPKETPRVVGQSVRAGRKVAAGTSVDLVLAATTDVPLEIFAGTHKDMRTRSLAELLEQTLDQDANETVRQIVLNRESETDLKDAEKELVLAMLEQADVEVDDTDPEKDMAAAYRTLRYASAYR